MSENTARDKFCQYTGSFYLIGNIPESLHSADLRSFFSRLVEAGSFVCFHYKHRPEHLTPSKVDDSLLHSSTVTTSEGSSTIVSIEDGSATIPSTGNSSSPVMVTGDRTVSTKCCVVVLERGREESLRSYSNKNWVDSNGDSMPMRVRVQKLTVTDRGLSNNDSHSDKDGSSLMWEDLKSLPELNPPKEMPKGNVGTPLTIFMSLIRSCKLPTHVIKKLKLEFPKSRSVHRYGAVRLDYGNHGNECGLEDVSEGDDNKFRKRRRRKEGSRSERDDQDDIDDEIGSDDDHDAEEWERYEALHNDVDKQGRTSERLFEEDMEVVWEKGGSGLVFYTDAAYWQEHEGDFDEQCSKEDDWNIDTSVYYDRTSGDRDALALREMTMEKRLREGIDEDDSWRGREGFEKHTKGFGSKVLLRSGWKVGEGVGASGQGISSPIELDGQHPHMKKGLGYRGEKLNRHMPTAKRPKKSTRDVVISTVYDRPDEQEDTMLRRAPVTTLKYNGTKFLTGGLLHKHDHEST